jgi:hypothetical protein
MPLPERMSDGGRPVAALISERCIDMVLSPLKKSMVTAEIANPHAMTRTENCFTVNDTLNS